MVGTTLEEVSELREYESPEGVVADLNPDYPIYCVRPHAIRRAAKVFVERFPGDTLYAVKCNPMPHVLKELYDAGIRHFDTASLAEISLVSDLLPDAVCYFMHPVKARSAIVEAHANYGVRHHVVDHRTELEKISEMIPPAPEVVILVRLAVRHQAVVYDLSSKFGTSVENAVDLVTEAASLGFSAGVSFHVGSQCLDADAFRTGIKCVSEVMQRTNVALQCVDVGGGFPGKYLNYSGQELSEYIDAIAEAARELELSEGCQLLCEPGRGLSADGESLIVQVQLRKGSAIYINDGVYGSMNEEMHGLRRLNRMVTTRDFSSTRQPFTLYGPTCDSMDVLPFPVELPEDIKEGDWIEFGAVGAYGAACRTAFNGFFADTFVAVQNEFASDNSVTS